MLSTTAQSSQNAVSRIGLGCAKFGSTLGGISGEAALSLLRHTLDAGVRVLDTADIYGQGDSERLIGQVLHKRRDGVLVVTKAGQRFTPTQQVARLAKAPIRYVTHAIPSLRERIAQRRAVPLPRDFSSAHMTRSIDASLRRLRIDRIDLFLMHSPDAASLTTPDAFAALNHAVRAGKTGGWGVSCDDALVARSALAIPQLSALQLPLAVARTLRPELTAAVGHGVRIFLREILTGTSSAVGRRTALHEALGFDQAIALIGTTSLAHLHEMLTYAQEEAKP